MTRSFRTVVNVICAVGGVAIIAIALTWLSRIDLPVWLGALIWSFVILAAIGTIGQIVETRRRKPVSFPTSEASEQIEIGEVSQQWIHVVKVLRDHSVIEKPHELPREDSPIVLAVDPGEVEVVIRATDRTWRRRPARRPRSIGGGLAARLSPVPDASVSSQTVLCGSRGRRPGRGRGAAWSGRRDPGVPDHPRRRRVRNEAWTTGWCRRRPTASLLPPIFNWIFSGN